MLIITPCFIISLLKYFYERGLEALLYKQVTYYMTYQLSSRIQISSHIGHRWLWSMEDWGAMSGLLSHQMSILGANECQFHIYVFSTRWYNSK